MTFICVNTPCSLYKGIDLTQLRKSIVKIGQLLAKGNGYPVIAVKSSVVPGTTEQIIIPTLERCSLKKAGKDFGVAANPEFLQEGRAIHCFLNPERIIIGQHDSRAGDILEEVYHDFAAPILRTNIMTAEMIKYASNAFLATKISFINEIGNMCKKLGIDAYEVAKGMGYDRRIGNEFLNAGIGFGGSCLPKDLEALFVKAQKLGYTAELLQSVLRVNKEQPLRLVEIMRERLGSLKNRKVAILGLAFKPGTDDIREAPALNIIAQLLAEGATVRVYDPKAMPRAKHVLSSDIEFCNNVRDAINDSECIVIATEWNEFKDERIYAGKLVIDGRRTLNPVKARELCQYEGVCW